MAIARMWLASRRGQMPRFFSRKFVIMQFDKSDYHGKPSQ